MRASRLVALCALVVATAAQPRCDPLTQYEHNGECCKMCGPGTSMSSLGTCLEPQCQQCGAKEYQDKYTRESKCQRQPYCDPNRNFQTPGFEITKRSSCLCKPGFHCSSAECIICVPHTACAAGHGVRSSGNHSHDTVCEKCPEGTFSERNSYDVCKTWTECGEGQRVERSGTDTSDNICVETSRTHIVVIIILVLLIFPGLMAALMCWRCRGKRRDANGKVKGCVESCVGEKEEPRREAAVLIVNPIDGAEEEATSLEPLPSQDQGSLRTPVEDEDDPSRETSMANVLWSEKGNVVVQENGKAEVLSRQESQTA